MRQRRMMDHSAHNATELRPRKRPHWLLSEKDVRQQVHSLALGLGVVAVLIVGIYPDFCLSFFAVTSGSLLMESIVSSALRCV